MQRCCRAATGMVTCCSACYTLVWVLMLVVVGIVVWYVAGAFVPV